MPIDWDCHGDCHAHDMTVGSVGSPSVGARYRMQCLMQYLMPCLQPSTVPRYIVWFWHDTVLVGFLRSATLPRVDL